MGRVVTPHREGLRTDAVLHALGDSAKRIAANTAEAQWYLFGSFTRRPMAAADVDVLVVCSSGSDAEAIRLQVDELSVGIPLHVLIMTQSEEAETNFITSERCIPFYPSSATSENADRCQHLSRSLPIARAGSRPGVKPGAVRLAGR